MSQNKLVSVICLCFNHEKFVTETLQSVLNQTYNNIELIILDDSSQDNSVHKIEKWLTNNPGILFIKNKKNLGVTKSFNKALHYAKGDYVIDLAADDLLLPNCIALQLKTFHESDIKNLGVVYGNAELIDENGKFSSYYFPVDSSKKVLEKRKTGNIYKSILSGGNSICSVTAMYKKEVYEQLNGYDENLVYEDLDFWIRASIIFNFDFVDDILVQKRIVNNSLGTNFNVKSENSNKINYSTFLILLKAFKLNKFKEEDKLLLKRVHHEMILNLKLKNYVLFLKLLKLKTIIFLRETLARY